jgi:hypothetical protein
MKPAGGDRFDESSDRGYTRVEAERTVLQLNVDDQKTVR